MIRRAPVVLALLTVACSESAPEATTPLAPKCGGVPEFEAPLSTLVAPQSRLTLEIQVPVTKAEEALSKSVPWQLAKAEGRSIGAAGKVSYVVKRGPLHLRAVDDALVVDTQLVADIDVCKPLGPLCVHYGSCQPEWRARVVVPMDWSLNEPPTPKLELSISEGCVLRPVGYDATPELRRITEEQARGARGQVQRELAKQYEALHAGLGEARDGVRFGEGPSDCVQFEPTQVRRTRLQEEQGVFALGVSLEGTTRFGCEKHAAPEPYQGGGAEFPSTEQVSELNPKSELLLGQEASFASVQEALTSDGKSVTLASGRLAGEPRLFAGVRGASNCDPEWLAVDALLNEDALWLSPLGVDRATSKSAQWLAQRGRAPLTDSMEKVDAALRELERRFRAQSTPELTRYGLELRGTMERGTFVDIGPDLLRPTLSYSGTLAILPLPTTKKE